MSEHWREQAAGAAIGALSREEMARLDEEAARDPALAAQLHEYRQTVSTLEASVAREAPPADLFEGVLARIEAGTSASPEVEPPTQHRSAFRERTRRLWPAFVAGAATAAAVIALAFVLSGGNDLGTPDASAAVSGTAEFPEVHGEARLYRSAGDDGTLTLELADVPAPGENEHYEVWVLRSTGGGEMEAVGAFSPTSSSVKLELPLPGPGTYKAVDVSVEENGGPAGHSGQSLAGGRF